MDFNLNNPTNGTGKEAVGVEKVIILGSGPAGLSAALYAARAELSPLIITGIEMGGQAALTNTIENYPGFPEGVGGLALGELFQKQAEKFGARFEFDSVTAVDFSKRPFKVTTYSRSYLAETVIITTGASPVHLNIPGEAEYVGKGTSYCATCDGYFFKNKKVVVVGGGDSALEEAIFLTRYASSVTIVHRRDELRAGAILQKRANENPKIDIIYDTVVTEITGNGVVQAVCLKNVKTGEMRDYTTDGVFIFIGHKPNSELYQGQVKMDERGYIVIDMQMRTSVSGIFAAGEIADPTYRQVVTSAGMGAAAAIQATSFLQHEEK